VRQVTGVEYQLLGVSVRESEAPIRRVACVWLREVSAVSRPDSIAKCAIEWGTRGLRRPPAS
jgi:hypothetical protein